MEYILQLEKQRKFKILIMGIGFLFLCLLGSFELLRFWGIIGFAIFLALMLFTPVLLNKYRFLLFSLAFSSIYFDKSIIFMAIFIPIGIIFFFKEIENIAKKFPAILSLIIFSGFILINIFRPDTELLSVYRVFRFHFLEIFMIIMTFLYLKKFPSLTLFNAINIFVSFNSLVAIFQRITGIGLIYNDGVARAMGFIGHPNIFSLLLNIFLPLAVYMSFFVKNQKIRNLWRASLILNILAFILTFSKTAFVVFLVGMVILFFFVPSKIKTRIISSFIIFFVLLLIADFVLNLKIFSSIIHRFSNSGSLEWRFRSWNMVMSGIHFSTVFIGNGVNKCAEYLQYLNPVRNANPHNVYLQNFFDYGLWSLLYYFPFLYLLKNFIKGLYSKKIYCLFPAIIIIEFFIDMISNPGVGIRSPFLITWVILIAFYHKLNSGFVDEENYIENNNFMIGLK